MTTDKDLEDLLRQVRLSTTAEQDERIVADALASIGQPAATDEVAASRRSAFSPLPAAARSLRRHWRLSTAAACALVLLVALSFALPRTEVADSGEADEVATLAESPENPDPPKDGRTLHRELGLAGSAKTNAARERNVVGGKCETPHASTLAVQPKSVNGVAVPTGKGELASAGKHFGISAAGRGTALGTAGLPGVLDAEQTIAKSPLIYKLRLTRVLDDLQRKVFSHKDTAKREILLEAEVLRVFKGDPKTAGQRVVLVWDTRVGGVPRWDSCLHAEQVLPKRATSGEAFYLMALTPAEPATAAEGRPRLKNIIHPGISGTRVSKAEVDPAKWATAKNPLERLKLELLGALDDPDADTRHSAIKGLRRWGGHLFSGGPLWKDKRAAERILAASKDPDWRVRWVVAWMIPEDAGDEGKKALVRLRSDTHQNVRQVAAHVLRKRGQEEPANKLLDEPLGGPALSDARPAHRRTLPRESYSDSDADRPAPDKAKAESAMAKAPQRRSFSDHDADRLAPDEAKIEAEAKQIAALAAARDIDGLVKMLSVAEFVNKVAAAEHLAEIGDQRALADLQKLNRSHGGWWIGGEPPDAVEDSETSAAFAWAIWSILHRDLTEEEQIAGLFDLLEGKGRAVPEDVMASTVHLNFDVGRRVGRQLEKHDDPAVVARLRRTKNKGAAISAVKMEVRGMDKQAAIDRCVQIAHDEDGAGRYGAIQVLGSFGSDAFDDLDALARQGHSLAITVLGYHKGRSPEALSLICWHLTNNSTYKVRLVAVNQFGTVMDRPGVVPALIKALYDPQKSIRHNAASSLSLEAYFKKSPHLEELEEAMLIARNHPDEDVRQLAVKALERLGSKRLNEPLVDPPPVRRTIPEPPAGKRR